MGKNEVPLFLFLGLFFFLVIIMVMKNCRKLTLISEIHCDMFRIVRKAKHEFCTWDWHCFFHKGSWKSGLMSR